MSKKTTSKKSSVWHKAANVSDFKEDHGQLIEIEGKKIALFRAHGKYYAIDNICPHRSGPLVQGHVEDGKVTCPWHAWQFDLRSGACDTMPDTKQKTYPTKIENKQIYIEI